MQSYVVYLGEHSHDDSNLYSAELEQRVLDSHHEFLASSLGRSVLLLFACFCKFIKFFFSSSYISFVIMEVV